MDIWIFLPDGRKMEIFWGVFTAHPPSKALNPSCFLASGVLGGHFWVWSKSFPTLLVFRVFLLSPVLIRRPGLSLYAPGGLSLSLSL